MRITLETRNNFFIKKCVDDYSSPPVVHPPVVPSCVSRCVRACARACVVPSSAPSHPRRSDLGVVKGVLPIDDLGVASALSPEPPASRAVDTWGT